MRATIRTSRSSAVTRSSGSGTSMVRSATTIWRCSSTPRCRSDASCCSPARTCSAARTTPAAAEADHDGASRRRHRANADGGAGNDAGDRGDLNLVGAARPVGDAAHRRHRRRSDVRGRLPSRLANTPPMIVSSQTEKRFVTPGATTRAPSHRDGRLHLQRQRRRARQPLHPHTPEFRRRSHAPTGCKRTMCGGPNHLPHTADSVRASRPTSPIPRSQRGVGVHGRRCVSAQRRGTVSVRPHSTGRRRRDRDLDVRGARVRILWKYPAVLPVERMRWFGMRFASGRRLEQACGVVRLLAATRADGVVTVGSP